MRIDVHAHWYPREVTKAFDRLGGPSYLVEHPDDMSTRFADMDEAGVDLQVLSMGAMQPYHGEPTSAAEVARIVNDVYATAIAQNQPRLTAFGCVALGDPDAAVSEAVRCIDELGFVGVGLGSACNERTLDHPDFSSLWDELDRRSTTVYLHPGVANEMLGTAEYPIMLGAIFGSPAETAISACRLVFKGIIARHPNIRVVVGATGGAVPFGWAKLLAASQAIGQRPQLVPDPDNPVYGELATYLRQFYYDCSHLEPAYVLAAQQSFGLDRLVFGSDAPHGSATRVLADIRNSDVIDDATAKLILDRNGALALNRVWAA